MQYLHTLGGFDLQLCLLYRRYEEKNPVECAKKAQSLLLASSHTKKTGPHDPVTWLMVWGAARTELYITKVTSTT